jgi:hypothetical protein
MRSEILPRQHYTTVSRQFNSKADEEKAALFYRGNVAVRPLIYFLASARPFCLLYNYFFST